MLKSLLNLFSANDVNAKPEYTVELATAALLSEIIRADTHIAPSEIEAYKAQLYEQFNVSEEALALLMKNGQSTAEEAVGLVQFTQVINQQCDNEQKWKILKGLWAIAYADNNIAPIEEHIIRRIADLLYLPHSLFIKAKLEVGASNEQ